MRKYAKIKGRIAHNLLITLPSFEANMTISLRNVHKTTPNEHLIPTNRIYTTMTTMRRRTMYCLNSTQLLSLSSLYKRHILRRNHICIMVKNVRAPKVYPIID